MTTLGFPIFTVGHSNHTPEEFLKILLAHNISVLADVRSTPYSRYAPHFSKDPLEQLIKRHGLKYVFLGEELGARTNDPACYVNGVVQYARIAQTKSFKRGVMRVLKGALEHRIALMCAEKEPLDCHRTLLVAHAISAHDREVIHILADGSVEHHTETMSRLLQISGLSNQDLFMTQEQLLSEALARQETRIVKRDDDIVEERAGEDK